MNEWQPIETAPRDGTRFVARGCARGDYGYTEDKDVEMFMVGGPFGYLIDQPTGRHFSGFKPTHWMPLPESPR